jgi:hypothetical protein
MKLFAFARTHLFAFEILAARQTPGLVRPAGQATISP